MNGIAIGLMLCALALVAGCSQEDNTPPNSTVNPVGGGFEVYATGENRVTRREEGWQLWFRADDGTRRMLWAKVASDQKFFGDILVFNGATADEQKDYPALFAITGTGKPVDITEYVTKTYCGTNKSDYGSTRGKYRYLVARRPDAGKVYLNGTNAPGVTVSPAGIEVVVSVEQVEEWMNEGLKSGAKQKYGGRDYYVGRPVEK